MSDGTVRSHSQGMAPERVLDATGRFPDDWYSLIDSAGGRAIGHTAIAAWLVDQGVDGWWAQGITIGYEQARGLRIPGQRSDGTFAVSASRQVSGDPEPVLDTLIPVFTATFGFEPTSQSRGGKRPSARWTSSDRETVIVTTEPGSKPDTVRIAVQRERLIGTERMPEAKAQLQELLRQL